MLRPLRRTKSKNTLKIDEYKVRIHKPSEENRHPPLAAKAIAVPIARPLEESTCRQDPNRLKVHSENHEGSCRCSRLERHQSAGNKTMVFRIQKSLKSHKFLQTMGVSSTQDSIILRPEYKQQVIQGIIGVLKKTETLQQNRQQQVLEIKCEDLKKIIDYLLFLKKRVFQKKPIQIQNENYDFLISQLDHLFQAQSMQMFRNYLNPPYEAELDLEEQERRIKFQQEKRKQQAALYDLQRMVDQKSAEKTELEEKISDFRSLLERYESKASNIKHYLNQENEVYIKQLCNEYHKRMNGLNSYSISIQACQSRNKGKGSSFQEIQLNMRNELNAIDDLLGDDERVQSQLTFVKDFLARVMQQLKAKYCQLQRMLSQKTVWITQLVKQIKELVEFSSFKHEYLQNSVNEFTLTYLQAESKLGMLGVQLKGLQKQGVSVDCNVVQQISGFMQKMNQNYLLTNSFN